MSKALPGEHYCLAHQGNHSHYDEKNCTVCRLRTELAEAREALRVIKQITNSPDIYDIARRALARNQQEHTPTTASERAGEALGDGVG